MWKNKYLLAFLVLVVATTTVLGHSWYPHECCHDNDCFPVPCEDIEILANGNGLYEGFEFAKDKIKNSLDSMCHACIGWEYGVQKIPRCLFLQNAV